MKVNEDGLGVPVLVVSNAAAPALSPDGRYLAFERGAGAKRTVFLAAADAPHHQTALLTPQDGTSCGAPAWAQDAQTLYFLCSEGGAPGLFRYQAGQITPVSVELYGGDGDDHKPTVGYLRFEGGAGFYDASSTSQLMLMLQLNGMQPVTVGWPLAE